MRYCFNITALLATLLILTIGCGTTHHLPSENNHTTIIIRDSIQVHKDTIVLEVPVESSASFNVQVSHLESSVAFSDAVVDSTGLLNHTLVNKPFKVEKEIVYVDKVVTQYRDSLVTKEVPVEVVTVKEVVPKWCWYLLVFDVFLLLVFVVKIYLKFKKP